MCLPASSRRTTTEEERRSVDEQLVTSVLVCRSGAEDLDTVAELRSTLPVHKQIAAEVRWEDAHDGRLVARCYRKSQMNTDIWKQTGWNLWVKFLALVKSKV